MASPHQLVRFKSGKITFEILTKPGTCLKFRQGKLGFDSVMFADEVFKNFAKGERPTNEELVYVVAIARVDDDDGGGSHVVLDRWLGLRSALITSRRSLCVS